MKEITFRAKLNEDVSIPSLLREINKIPCRLYVDFECNLVIAENITDTAIDPICDLVHNFFSVDSLDIDNTDDSISFYSDDTNDLDDSDEEISDNYEIVLNTNSNSQDTKILAPRKPDQTSNPHKYKKQNYSKNSLKKIYEKFEAEKAALLEIIGLAVDKLDSSIPVNDQIESFLSDIGMPVLGLIVQSFEIACTIDKLNYPNLIYELKLLHPNIDYDYIESNVKKTFNNWVQEHVTLAEKHPTISFISLLKVFSAVFS